MIDYRKGRCMESSRPEPVVSSSHDRTLLAYSGTLLDYNNPSTVKPAFGKFADDDLSFHRRFNREFLLIEWRQHVR